MKAEERIHGYIEEREEEIIRTTKVYALTMLDLLGAE